MSAPCPVVTTKSAQPIVMPAGTIKRIHVNQHIIRANIKTGADEPTVTVQWKGKSYVARDVVIKSASTVMQRMTQPLSCGARIWIETRGEVELL